MKKILLFVLLLTSVVANAQKGISYQAVILDPSKIEIPGQDISGQPFVNGNVSVKFVILSGTTSQFEEVQQTKTDAYGLVNLTIGSAANTAFNALTWDAVQKSLQVFVSFNNGASYTKVSDQKLTYTPYALFAETAGKLGSTLGIAGGGTGATTAAGARTNLGLGNVDNTADAAKPISTATQAALDLKANSADVNAALALKATVAALQAHMAITADTTMLATKAALTDLTNYAPKASPTFTGTVSGIDKTMVGLGSVDNTSDAAKPVSAATQAALDLKANVVDVNAITNVIALKVNQSSLASVATSGSFNDLINKPTGYVTSVGNISGSSNSNGAVITSGVLSLTPADVSFGGIVTNGTQTIAGNKTLNGNTAFANNINVKGLVIGLGTGSQSTLFGNSAAAYGNNSTAIGFMSQNGNTGLNNTSVGSNTLRNTSTGSYNTAVGSESGQVIASYNTFIGASTNGAANVSNATALGYGAYLTESNTIQLGANGFNGTTPITKVKTSGTITAGAITYPNTAGSNGQVLTTNGSVASWVSPTSVTVGTISNTSNINGATITAGGVLNLAPADATNGGVVTNGTQTFAGVKTFNDGISYLKTNAAALDQSNPTAANSIGGDKVWQSFTAGVTGKLSSVEFKMISPLQDYSAATYTVKIYDGEGITGTLLGTTTGIVSGSSWNFFPFDFTNAKISVVSGQLYTIYISTPTLYFANLYVNINDSYASGRASPLSNWDLVFKTYVSPTTVDSYLPLSGGSLTGNLVVGATSATGTSAALEVKSTTQGLLLPRLTTAQRDAISSPVEGLVVYNTTAGKFQGYTANAASTVYSNTNYNGGGSYMGLGNFDMMGMNAINDDGQSFSVPSSYTLNSIAIRFQSVNYTSNITLSVYSGIIGSGTLLGSVTNSVSSTGEKIFTFSSPISLTAGNYYFQVHGSLTTNSGLNYSNSPYGSGSFFQTQQINGGNVSYNSNPNQSLYFILNFSLPGWADLN